MTPNESKRYKIDNFDAFLRVLHTDHRYALEFRNTAEQLITAKLRRKFFQVSPDAVLDAFNNALMKLLETRTFRDEGFQKGQPAEGWTALELATSSLAGYLYRASANELITAYRKSKYYLEPLKDDEQQSTPGKPDDINNLPDENPLNDPAMAYEYATQLKRVRECIAKLSDTLRSTMFLMLDGLKQPDISEQQGIPLNTVKTRIHSANKLVEACVKKGMNE